MKLLGLLWHIRDILWERHIRFRYRCVGLSKPVYDRKKDIYYVENRMGNLEEGCIEYIVGEYAIAGLCYRFSIKGKMDHEHTFGGVLSSILNDDGETFFIPDEYIQDYSNQEISMINKLLAQLRLDNELFVCNSGGCVPMFRGRQARKWFKKMKTAKPSDLSELNRRADEFERQLLEKKKSYTVDDVMQMDEHVELIHGKLHVECGIPVDASEVGLGIACGLMAYIEEHGLPDKLFYYSVALLVGDILEDEKDTLLMPDIMVVSSSEDFDDDGVHKTPKFVVEVTTERSKALDYKEKCKLYCDMGVDEYWIVDLQQDYVYKYLRKDDYIPEVCENLKAVEVSSYPGLVIDVDDLKKH